MGQSWDIKGTSWPITKDSFPDAPQDCHTYADLARGCLGGQWGGIYGSPMECVGFGAGQNSHVPTCELVRDALLDSPQPGGHLHGHGAPHLAPCLRLLWPQDGLRAAAGAGSHHGVGR